MDIVLNKKQVEAAAAASDFQQDTGEVIKDILKQSIASGQVGNVRVDPSYLQFEQQIGK